MDDHTCKIKSFVTDHKRADEGNLHICGGFANANILMEILGH